MKEGLKTDSGGFTTSYRALQISPVSSSHIDPTKISLICLSVITTSALLTAIAIRMFRRRLRSRRNRSQGGIELQAIHRVHQRLDRDAETAESSREETRPLNPDPHLYEEVNSDSLYSNIHDQNLVRIQYQNVFYDAFNSS